MKTIFNEFNESIKNLMTGPSKDDYMIELEVIKNDMLSLIDGDKKYTVIGEWEENGKLEWEQLTSKPVTLIEAEKIKLKSIKSKWPSHILHREYITCWENYVNKYIDYVIKNQKI